MLKVRLPFWRKLFTASGRKWQHQLKIFLRGARASSSFPGIKRRAAAPAVGAIMARELGWSPVQQKDAVEEYVNKINRLMQLIGLRP